MIGQVVDEKYEIIRLIGEGGMGAVYEAVHKESGRRVAVKVISIDNLSRSEEILARFEREVRAAGAIETRHIVQVLDAGRDRQAGLPYMVMELLKGEDLQAVLERIGPLSERLALRIAAHACVGLQRAHDAGVVHRDIKPANLFLSQVRDAALSKTGGSELIVKLLDFGIAKVKMDQLGAGGQGLTRTGSMLGTPLYMSPEQAKGLKTIDHRTDLWSLGAVLYQALAGWPPFYEDTVGQLILAICSDPLKPIQDVAPWVSPEVANIVHRALRRDPQERFQNATEMLTPIGEFLGDDWNLTAEQIQPIPEEVRATVARRVVIVTDRGAPTGRDSVEQQGVASTYLGTTGGVARRLSSTPPGVRRLSAKIGAGAALGALVAGVGYYAVRERQPPAEATAAPSAPATVASAAPSPEPTVAPSTAAEPAKRTVRVMVPDKATATVDGETLLVKDGAIELTGPPGSKHIVQVAVGKRKVERQVVVTEDGAFPSQIKLPREAGGTPLQRGSPGSTPPAAGAPGASAATHPPQHATKFE